ncbi:hypothetical protein N9W89_00715 [Hellea sp.]|nr:hypothetical protein [Hellea sp.]
MQLIYRILGWVGILVYGALIYEMWRLWSAPTPDDTGRILTLAVMMGFEFIMVHSGIFMAAFPRKISLFIFVPFYGAFALVFNSMTPGNEILFLYLGAVFIRMRFAFSNATEEEIGANMSMSFLAVVLYFFLIIAFSIGSDHIPELGLTREFLTTTNYLNEDTIGGIFTEMPQVSMAMGMVYFGLLAFAEIKVYKLLKPLPA